MFDFFKKWFPPALQSIKHVVINSLAQDELKKRTGIKSTVISDTFDFNSRLNKLDDFSENWKKDFNINDSDIVFLQATRIVPRKQIEFSIKLVKKLKRKDVVLVIAGCSGDEGKEYEKKLKKLVKQTGIRCKFIGNRINSHRKIINGKRTYTLWDCFVNADLVTYPTKVEGFGNQFIESCYFKKPVFLTGYPVFEADIKPLGFEVARNTKQVEELLNNKDLRKKTVEKNFELAKKHYSYKATAKKIKKLL